MARSADGYFKATRHPWPCLIFLLPLLLVYEGGMFYFGGPEAEKLRTGADTWLRWSFQAFGVPALYGPPIIIAVIFVVWNWIRMGDRPAELVSTWLGMAVESLAFALLLWGLGRLQEPLHDAVAAAQAQAPPPQAALALSFIGAGIYEELLFRLMLFPVLLRVITFTEMPGPAAVGLAMLLSALAFSGAHHLGPFGEPYTHRVFLFRSLAGLYFVIIFQSRGFGIAVGAHACYDVLVGVAMT